MTSASELFYTRRSRLNRITFDDPSPGLNFNYGSSNYNSRRHHFQNHHRDGTGISSSSSRHVMGGCDPLRRSTHARLRPSQLEGDPVRFNQSTSQQSPGNHVVSDTLSNRNNRPTASRNERLPGAVLMARDRLLQRLRGVSISERGNNRGRLPRNQNDNALSNDFRLADAGDWEIELLSASSARSSRTSSSDLTSEIDLSTSLNKPGDKPPGLSQDAIDCLVTEVFSGTDDGVRAMESWDCSICLESFGTGALLVRLPCSHRFHYACLDPWVRTCGDCPYCRRGIL